VRQYVEEVGVKNVTWSDANDSAFAFAMAQNHPSGDPSPSDVELSNSGLSELPRGSNSSARQMLISGKFKSEFFFSPHN
jgi:hypothetical protein